MFQIFGLFRERVGQAGDQLRIGADRRPGPDIAIAKFVSQFLGDVLFLGVTEGPDSIDLDTLTGQVAHDKVMVFLTGFPNIHQQLRDGVLGGSGEPTGSTNRGALYEVSQDLRPAIVLIACSCVYDTNNCMIGQALWSVWIEKLSKSLK